MYVLDDNAIFDQGGCFMKKFFILTSILTLAACGGGSGGGQPDGVVVVPGTSYVDPVRKSNSDVTGMVSNSEAQIVRYVEYKLGEDAAVVLPPSAKSTAKSNNRFSTSIELVELADWLVNVATEQEIAEMFDSSVIEQNKIKAALKLMDGMWCYVGGNSAETARRIKQEGHFESALADLKEKTELFDLRNVNFTMAATSGSGGDEGGHAKDTLKFHLDPTTGQIDALEYHVLEYQDGNWVEDEDAAATFERIGETGNSFNIGQTNGEGHVINARAKILTYGRDLGLQYSDFGQIKSEQDITYQDGHTEHQYGYEAFAGGYQDPEIKKASPDVAMNFTGKAAGAVSNNGIDKNIKGDATLAFNNGTETLNMYFSHTETTNDDIPWYDVKIVRNGPSGNTIAFTTNETLNENIPDNFKFNENEFVNSVRTPTNYHLVDGYNGEGYGDKTTGTGYGKLDIGYYGPRNDGVTEATGITQYVESLGENGEIRMNVGFGVIKD